MNQETKEEEINNPMRKIMKKILALPYSQGCIFEKNIENIIQETGLNKFNITDQWKKNNNWVYNLINNKDQIKNLIPNNNFICQPFGIQQNPDFIIHSNNKMTYLEAKSCKGKKPMYNSGGIHHSYIYAFCSKKTNKTTLYKGSDIITQEQNKLIEQHIRKARILDEELNKKLDELDSNNRGVCYYTRPMIQQHGNNTDYFNHKNRFKCEQNVIDLFN